MTVKIVWGSPRSGKTTYVRQHMESEDLVIDLDYLKAALRLEPDADSVRYSMPFKLIKDILDIRDFIYGGISKKIRGGRYAWSTLWIVAGLPTWQERKDLAYRFSAELIRIDTSMEECLSRCVSDLEEKIVRRWWSSYTDEPAGQTWTQAEADRFYHTPEWRRLRAEVLGLDHHECQMCKAKGIYTKATCVHHVLHIREHPEHRADIYVNGERNLVSLCDECHNVCHPEKGNHAINASKAFNNTERW